MQHRRIAVIGSGVSGLTAAYILRESAEVTLFEAQDRLGGHAHTHRVRADRGSELHIDTGFIGYNRHTYPHLRRLLSELGVASQGIGMGLSVRCEGCGLEYAGSRGLRGLTARPAQLRDARYLRLLTEIPRFHRAARQLLAAGHAPGSLSLGSFLDSHAFSPYFVTHFITPLVCAVWSCDPPAARHFPAHHLFTFMQHQGLLSIRPTHGWLSVTGGSRTYVERLAGLLGDVRTGAPVHSVRRTATGVRLGLGGTQEETYDAVVVAVHADQALRMLADPTDLERRVLGAFSYTSNLITLHTDTSVLPRSTGARASWNYLMPSCDATTDKVHISYDLTRLQRLGTPRTYLTTLNGAGRVAADHVLADTEYEHPLYTEQAVAALPQLPRLSGPVTAYAGAYHGWGFHEDGCTSGVRAALALGVRW